MSEAVEKITKEQEEKRLEDFKVIAENWDKFPERVQGENRWNHFNGCICIFKRNKKSRINRRQA